MDLLDSKMVRHDVCGDTIRDLITRGHPPQQSPVVNEGIPGSTTLSAIFTDESKEPISCPNIAGQSWTG
jgi:hypothetical protein